jgi:hypothetical protein
VTPQQPAPAVALLVWFYDGSTLRRSYCQTISDLYAFAPAAPIDF